MAGQSPQNHPGIDLKPRCASSWIGRGTDHRGQARHEDKAKRCTENVGSASSELDLSMVSMCVFPQQVYKNTLWNVPKESPSDSDFNTPTIWLGSWTTLVKL